MDEIANRILNHIRADRLVELARAVCDVNSPTGSEAEVAQILTRLFADAGMRAHLQDVEDERPNAVGVLRGRGGGRTLMFNGHIDTSYPFLLGLTGSGLMERPLPSEVHGGWLYATGVDNNKAMFACAIAAVEALREANVRVNGDIIISGVVGHIEASPVDRYQGRRYRGFGKGTAHLLGHGGVADFCIIGEATNLKINLGHCGALWTKITTFGPIMGSYKSKWEESPLNRASRIIDRLITWRDSYTERYRHKSIAPMVTIVGIEGGWPWPAARSPGSCTIYVDVRTAPNQVLMTARDELIDLVRSFDPEEEPFHSEVEFYASVPGYEIDEHADVVQAVQRAHTSLHGKPAEYSYYQAMDDSSHFGRFDIPTVVYGPGGSVRTDGKGPLNEYVRIENMVECAKVYALTALDVCNWPSSSRRTHI